MFLVSVDVASSSWSSPVEDKMEKVHAYPHMYISEVYCTRNLMRSNEYSLLRKYVHGCLHIAIFKIAIVRILSVFIEIN